MLSLSFISVVVGCGTEVWHPVVPAARNGIGVVVTAATDVDEEEHAKVERALVLLDAVLHDDAFFQAVAAGPDLDKMQTVVNKYGRGQNTEKTTLSIGQTYAWNSLAEGSAKPAPISNEAIVDLLRQAKEPGGQHDGMLEFGIRRNRRPLALWCGWPWYGEIGHREPPNVVMTQDCKMSKMSAPMLAGHWLHEYMHMLGFDHAPEPDPMRDFSVPYFVGNLAEAMAVKIDEKPAGTASAPAAAGPAPAPK